MRKLPVIFWMMLLPLLCSAQEHLLQIPDTLVTEFPKEYLDTVQIKKKTQINDYSMIGASYGIVMSQQIFNPSKLQDWLFTPSYISVTFTHYEKMFNYLPYFGYQIGVAYSHEGYQLSKDSKTGQYYETIYGAYKATYDMIEIPFVIQAHFDTQFFRFLIDLGLYGGYRFKITREGPNVKDEMVHSFAPEDYRWDYGIQGGAGFGLVFEPVELHFKAAVRYGFSTLWDPSRYQGQYSPYYYKFANPLDIMFTVGIHFHLSKRYGYSDKKLRKKAREMVYGPKNETAQ